MSPGAEGKLGVQWLAPRLTIIVLKQSRGETLMKVRSLLTQLPYPIGQLSNHIVTKACQAQSPNLIHPGLYHKRAVISNCSGNQESKKATDEMSIPRGWRFERAMLHVHRLQENCLPETVKRARKRGKKQYPQTGDHFNSATRNLAFMMI
jgi:hypothetical protein